MTKEQLKQRDYHLAIDRSGSMGTGDCAGNQTRWNYAKETTIGLANKMVEYDADGINVIMFSDGLKNYQNVNNTQLVDKIFDENEPGGGTNTLEVLKSTCEDYLKRYAANPETTKPITLVIVTDGEPNDGDAGKKAIEEYIIGVTKRMDKDEQIGISLIQIGFNKEAGEWLKKLDDGLVAKGAKFDIVDVKTAAELGNMTITEALIAALED